VLAEVMDHLTAELFKSIANLIKKVAATDIVKRAVQEKAKPDEEQRVKRRAMTRR
jgi:hypothetical protein